MTELLQQPSIMAHAIEIELIHDAKGISKDYVIAKVRAKRGFYLVSEITELISKADLIRKRQTTLTLLWLMMGKQLRETFYQEEDSTIIQQSA